LYFSIISDIIILNILILEMINLNIKLELISNAVTETVKNKLGDISVDADKIADTTAIKALSEIKNVIKDESIDDFYAVEEILCIFEKYGIDAGNRHDF